MNFRHYITYQFVRGTTVLIIGIVLFLLNMAYPSSAGAQFVNLNMEIETEFSASTKQNLDFGTIPVQSGLNRINLGDQGMGVVSFRGLRYQRLFISVDEPEELVHADSEEDRSIPIDLNFAYNNRGSDNPDQSNILDEYGTTVTLLGEEGADLSDTEGISEFLQSQWAHMYIYIYGSIDVGNVPTGVYRNQVTVSIEY